MDVKEIAPIFVFMCVCAFVYVFNEKEYRDGEGMEREVKDKQNQEV